MQLNTVVNKGTYIHCCTQVYVKLKDKTGRTNL